jgi:hypothetical protein
MQTNRSRRFVIAKLTDNFSKALPRLNVQSHESEPGITHIDENNRLPQSLA